MTLDVLPILEPPSSRHHVSPQPKEYEEVALAPKLLQDDPQLQTPEEQASLE